jgi:hypothetical protein
MTSTTFARALGLAALTLVASGGAAFAARRTYVSVAGTDANVCTFAAPCRTFDRAVAMVDAGGEVIVLDSAGYGAATIGKAASIIAPAGVDAGISVFGPSSPRDGISVLAGAPTASCCAAFRSTSKGAQTGSPFGKAETSRSRTDRSQGFRRASIARRTIRRGLPCTIPWFGEAPTRR